MRTEFKRTLVIAIFATVFVAGCGRQSEVFSAKTPAELKQLTDVTDAVVLLARSKEQGAEPGAGRDAIRQVALTVGAAERQYQWHSKAILNIENAATLGCIDAQSIEILDLETILARLDASIQEKDEAKVGGRKALLQSMAMNANECAAHSSILLVEGDKRPEALQHGSVVISQIYAIAAATRVASGLFLGPLLESQVRTYESIVAKLGPKHDVPVVTDALPKLKEAVAMLEKSESVPR